jgi:hypothetical protein
MGHTSILSTTTVLVFDDGVVVVDELYRIHRRRQNSVCGRLTIENSPTTTNDTTTSIPIRDYRNGSYDVDVGSITKQPQRDFEYIQLMHHKLLLYQLGVLALGPGLKSRHYLALFIASPRTNGPRQTVLWSYVQYTISGW